MLHQKELTAQEDMGSRKRRAHYKKSEGNLHQDNKQESQADKTHSRSREHRVQTGAGQNDPRDICQEDKLTEIADCLIFSFARSFRQLGESLGIKE